MRRIHTYPWHDQWVTEPMTDWQAFLNDLKLFGVKIAVLNLWALKTMRPQRRCKLIPFPPPATARKWYRDRAKAANGPTD